MTDPNTPEEPAAAAPPPAMPQQPQTASLPPLPEVNLNPVQSPSNPLPQGQPYAPPPQGQPYPAPQGEPVVQPHSDGKSIIVLLLGIGGFIVGFIPSLIALFMAKGAREEYHQSGGRVGNLSYIKFGVILSWLVIAFSILAFILILGLFSIAVLAGSGSTMENYTY